MWPADAYPRYKLEWPSCNSVAVDWTRRHRLFEVFIFRKVLWYWKHFTTKALESRLLWIPLMLQWASSDLNTTSVPQLVPDWCPPNLWQLTGLAPWNPWRFAVRPATGSTPTSGVTTTPTEGARQGKQGTSRPKLWNPSEFVERSLDNQKKRLIFVQFFLVFGLLDVWLSSCEITCVWQHWRALGEPKKDAELKLFLFPWNS